MRLEILAAESLGARGLCCRVQTADRVVVIDPGLALGERRHGLPPHPIQIAVGRAIRWRIVRALQEATDVVFSHYHGDHVPLVDANPYQLAFAQLPPGFGSLRGWGLSPESQTPRSRDRARALMNRMETRFRVAEGIEEGPLRFSPARRHGIGGLPAGSVMLTRVDLGGRVFVHASDIQLLDAGTIDCILDWDPDWVLAAGPPLYRGSTDARQRTGAWHNACRLAAGVRTLILDHHLMRSVEGEEWLEEISLASGRRIFCAADFMGRPRRLLEARRRELYAAMPVRPGWHQGYARGSATVDDFAPSGEAARDQSDERSRPRESGCRSGA